MPSVGTKLLAAGLLFALAHQAATAAPVPKGAKKADYFPLAVGHKWEYAGSRQQTTEVTEAADAADGKGREYTVVTKNKTGPDTTQVFLVLDGTVSLLRNGPTAKPTPLLKPAVWLKTDLQPGDKWQRTFERTATSRSTFDFEAVEVEKVTVQDKEYAAMRVTSTPEKGAQKTLHWYADGVGIIKTELNGTATLELKSFTPGDGKPAKK